MSNLKTNRTTGKRLPRRVAHELATIYDVVDRGFICHIGFVDQGSPIVIPTAYCRIGDSLYIHGSEKSRMLSVALSGVELCITITHLDGLVLARSAFHHSVNYRSVVIFTKAQMVDEPQKKMEILKAFTEHVIPGRWKDVRWPNDQEMKSTRVLKFSIREASLKTRDGDPKDDEADMNLDCWAGVIPTQTKILKPIADSKLKPDIACPDYLLHYKLPNER